MSVASFCSSLPARPFGHQDGRGTTDMVRLAANLPTQACRLKRWNKWQCCVAVNDATGVQSPEKFFEVEIEKDFEPFLNVHKKKASILRFNNIERLGRFDGVDPPYVEPSPESLLISEKSPVRFKDVVIDSGTKLKVRIHLPPAAESGKLPVLVYFHGGAFIVEDVGSPPYHNYMQKLAQEANILIVSVNYRLAPEYFLPVAYNDCKTALNWVIKQADATKHTKEKPAEEWIAKYGDTNRLFLSGDSAGGNITHNIAIDSDTTDNIEGIALIHPYFFGKVPEETEKKDPASLLLHRKLWSFIAPNSEGLDDPQVNPLGPTAKSLDGKSLSKVKGRRAVVFVAGEDFHSERAKRYNDELTEKFKGDVWQLCNHDGVGHVYHLSADAKEFKKESEAAWKMMDDLLKFYTNNGNLLKDDVVVTLKDVTEKSINNMKNTEKKMADKMMKQLVAFFQNDKVAFEAAN